MLAVAFLSWWYGQGWALVFKNMQRRITQIEQAFSVTMLLRTLFSPWRRVVTYPGSSLNAHLQALVDNLISRFVGFTVRIAVIITAGIMITGLAIVALIEVVAWPLVPLAIILGIIKGLLP